MKTTLLFGTIFLLGSLAYSQTLLTQSVDPVTVNDQGIACWSSPSAVPPGNGEYRENSFFRVYDITQFGITDSFRISALQFGVGDVDEGKELILSIYTSNILDLNQSILELVAQTTYIASNADDLTLVEVPFDAVIPPNSLVVFEVFAPDGGTNLNETYFPGINDAGENDDGYWKSIPCLTPLPIPIFPFIGMENSYVMNVVGENFILGVDDVPLNPVKIFPNPVTKDLFLNYNENVAIETVTLYKPDGSSIEILALEKKIDVSHLASGLYFLKIKTSTGSYTEKFIKK